MSTCRAGCELALPFEILEGNSSSCPEEMQRVVKVRHCASELCVASMSPFEALRRWISMA